MLKTKYVNNQYPTSIFKISKSDRHYNRALKREIRVWRSVTSESDLDSFEFLNGNFIYNNLDIEIKNNRDWLDFIGLLGSYNKGLILGGGNAGFEKYLLRKGTVKQFENIDIIFDEKKASRTSELFTDLNFVSLKENSYDIIIAKSILHHIINLEHLLTQVNRALKQDGIFIVFEYIGESKQQWRNDKIVFINNLLKEMNLEVFKGCYDNTVPFESIRSEELSGIIDQIFSKTKIVEHKWDYIYTSAKMGLFHFQLNKNLKIDNSDMVIIEKCLLEAENNALIHTFLPTHIFGVYKKSELEPDFVVEKWDKKKIKKELDLNLKNRSLSLYKKIKIIIFDYCNYLIKA